MYLINNKFLLSPMSPTFFGKHRLYGRFAPALCVHSINIRCLQKKWVTGDTVQGVQKYAGKSRAEVRK